MSRERSREFIGLHRRQFGSLVEFVGKLSNVGILVGCAEEVTTNLISNVFVREYFEEFHKNIHRVSIFNFGYRPRVGCTDVFTFFFIPKCSNWATGLNYIDFAFFYLFSPSNPLFLAVIILPQLTFSSIARKICSFKCLSTIIGNPRNSTTIAVSAQSSSDAVGKKM